MSRLSSSCRPARTIPAVLLAVLSTPAVAPAQRPAWVPLSTAAATVSSEQRDASMWMFDAPTDSFGLGQSSGGMSLRLLRPAVAGQDLALEFDSPSQVGWLAVHLVTEPAPTHFVDLPLACSSRAGSTA